MSSIAYTQLTTALASHQIDYRIHAHEPVRTLQDVEMRLGFDVEQLVKTLAVRVGDALVLVALRGVDRLEYGKLAAAMETTRSAITLATPEDVREQLGAQIGGIPPVTLAPGVRMIFDARVARIERLYCGVGDNDKTLEVNTRQLIDLFKPQLADISAS